MKAEEVIKEYELFRGLTQEMLDGIEKDDWDRIGHISERREKLLQGLMVLDDTLMTDSVERMRWSDLIRECLEMNVKMQALIEEKMGLYRRTTFTKRNSFKPITNIQKDNSSPPPFMFTE